MGGPAKKYDGGNINFVVEKRVADALREEAARRNMIRSDLLREILDKWYKTVTRNRAKESDATATTGDAA
jgi:hypothetical protein